MPETFEWEKFGVVFDITVLTMPAPVYEMVVLKDEGWLRRLLLDKQRNT